MKEIVPQTSRSDTQIRHVMHGYATHARAFLPSDFVSIENKDAENEIPKLDVAGSIPVARSIFFPRGEKIFRWSRSIKISSYGRKPREALRIARIAGLTPVASGRARSQSQRNSSRRLLPCFFDATIRVIPGSFPHASEQPARDRCPNSTMILMPCSSCR
jgi:hypothetical protein